MGEDQGEGGGEEEEGCEEDELHRCSVHEGEGCKLNQGRNLWCGDAHSKAIIKQGERMEQITHMNIVSFIFVFTLLGVYFLA